MFLASADFIVWFIIAIVVMISKAYNKFQESNEADEEPASPPLPRPRPRPVAPFPKARPAPASAPPVIANVPAAVRDLVNRLAQPTRPTPAPPPAPVKPAEPEPAKPVPAAAALPPPPPSRSSQWATALRDRSNVRNIIIAAEIIGPPKGT